MSEMVRDYHTWTYLILFLIIFCETGLVVTPFLPGDSLLFVAGAIAAQPDMPLEVNILVLIVFAAAVLGDSSNYMIGHFLGKKLFSNPNSKIFKQSYLDKTHEFYKKYGGKTIIIARFVPIVRTFAPFVAGMGKMHYYYFMLYNVTGGLLWVALFCYAGYFFGDLPKRYPTRVGSYIGYSNELAHLIEAGCDLFVMPSLFEPCGLNQMYSLKYGTLPIVHATGGLEDTVENYNEQTGEGTGFKFYDSTASAL